MQMSTQKLHFLESPILPNTDFPAIKRQQPGLPALKEPTPTDLRWLQVEQWLAAKSLAQNTKRSYRKELTRFWHWTDKSWSQITTWDITRYKNYLETAIIQDPGTGIPKRQLSPNSIALAVRSLKSFFAWMQQANYIAENPTIAVNAPNEPEPESKELTEVQVKMLYAALEQRGNLKLRDTALLAVLSHGLRAEEASQLNIEDYDGARLHIRKAKQGSIGKVPVDKTAQAAIDIYLEWRCHQGEQLVLNTPLFINYSRNSNVQGNRLSYNGIYSVIKQLGQLAVALALNQVSEQPQGSSMEELVGWELAALAKIHPHQLRHTFASNLVLGGIDVYLAMALTRHRSLSAFKRYSSKARERQAERAFRQMCGENSDDKAYE